MNARDAAKAAEPRLREAGVPSPAFEAELLARSTAGLTRAEYFAHGSAVPVPAERFSERLRRRLTREPFAYIHGEREFFGRAFAVGPGVLIPRPETEMLVDFALEQLDRRPGAVVADVGTGSGAIAVSVAAERPGTHVVALDISPAALAYAAENARHWAPAVECIAGDLLAPLRQADIILANLPYIPAGEIDALEPEVSRWEPRVALDGGPDGFALIARLLSAIASDFRQATVALEVGYGQATRVTEIAAGLGASATIRKDLAGIDRMVMISWE